MLSKIFDSKYCFKMYQAFMKIRQSAFLSKIDAFHVNSTLSFISKISMIFYENLTLSFASKSSKFYSKIRHWVLLQIARCFDNFDTEFCFKMDEVFMKIKKLIFLFKIDAFQKRSTLSCASTTFLVNLNAIHKNLTMSFAS